jgi:ectoine hydroxylase-related dioxygenase (phytanoyl-CoA dioxygenase family)
MKGELWKTLKINDLKKPKFKPLLLDVGDVVFFNGFVPHYSNNNLSNTDRTQMYITFNPKKQGNWREKYYKDKIKSYPPNSQNIKKTKQVYKV